MRVAGFLAALGLAGAMAGSAAAASLTHAYDFATSTTVAGQTYAVDVVGTENGLLVGSGGISGGALSLSGGTVDFAAFMIPVGSADYSVFLRARSSEANSGIRELISQGYSGGPGFYIGPYGSAFRLTDSIPYSGVNFINDGAYHDYLFVNDASNSQSRFYVDGVIQMTAGAVSIGAGGTPTRLGGQFGGYGEHFVGSYDEVRIYSGAATVAESQQPLSVAPEPAGWALMIMGFGGMGAVLRAGRRRGLLHP